MAIICVSLQGTNWSGDIGLVTLGYLYVHPRGRAMKYQAGIHQDQMIAGLKKLVDAVAPFAGPDLEFYKSCGKELQPGFASLADRGS